MTLFWFDILGSKPTNRNADVLNPDLDFVYAKVQVVLTRLLMLLLGNIRKNIHENENSITVLR